MKKLKSPSTPPQQLVPAEIIERQIFFIRGRKVMLDRELAQLYGLPQAT